VGGNGENKGCIVKGCVSKIEPQMLDAGLLNTRMDEWVGIL
jgi:hypothetical protein